MQVRFHLPRKSEAEITPEQEEDIVITPKFYKRNGWFPISHFTTEDANGHEEKYVLIISAGTGQVRVEKLVEVLPAIDEPVSKRAKKDAGTNNASGQTDDKTVKDENVH